MSEGAEGVTPPADGSPFRVEFVPGVTPDKWLRVWARRLPDSPIEAEPVDDEHAVAHLHDGTSSMALLRLPVDRDGLHVIPLYEEVPVVVVAKDHVVAAFDEVDVADLATEVLMQEPDLVPEWAEVADPEVRERSAAMPPMSAKQSISVVASGSGIVIVPMSVARLHHRKDVVHRPVRGVAPSGVGLAWRVDDEDPRLEEFIGIVRGRTERSTRGGAGSVVGAPADPPGGAGGKRSRSEPSRKGSAKEGPRQARTRQKPGSAKGSSGAGNAGHRGRGGAAGTRGRRKGGR
ncbi:LysR substrate-binding domain-containing protein [Terrabacter terrigena]|uniref:LysR substrate-binding domain-containing protein n=1 Tax=Terrabacter terrigena TaxID=574718 RepID=A0ABW3MXL0_9MICO